MAGGNSSNFDKQWEKSGKSDFIKQCQSFESDKDKLRSLVYEVCNKVVVGLLRPEALLPALCEVITTNDELANVLSDVLLLCDIETAASENKDHRETFSLLLTIINNKAISEWILKERLEYETTGDAKIIPNKKNASTKFIKLKTRLYYKQQKFNLFREESEGYAKLIVELCQHAGFNHHHMLQIIKSLIGCFNLDPNRVLDVILECFETRAHIKDCYVPLLRNYLDTSTSLSQILAFKLSFYHNELDNETPESLYEVIALLLYHQLIELHEIYSYLSPSDSKILEQFNTDLSEAKEIARKVNVISTGDKPVEDAQPALSVEEDKASNFVNNQKLGLVLALIKIGDWIHAKELIYKLPEYYAVSHENITKELCTLINFAIDKLYRETCGLPSKIGSKLKPFKCSRQFYIKQVTSTLELKTLVFPMIVSVGPFLSRDTLLIAKIIRICCSIMSSSNSDMIKYDVLTVLDDAVLPAMSLVESDSALSEDLWTLVRLFPYQNRYKLYTNWKDNPNNADMIRNRANTTKRIKYIMKRLSKETVKMSGRQIGKLTHSNPSFIFEYILSQIQNYDNMIGPVVDSLKYLTTIAYDVLVFCIIESLANPYRERTKHDGASISPWLISLGSFCGSVVKKYPTELPGLLQFIANQLKAEKSLDLLVLKEIVQKMAGIETTEEMTDEQIAALSGGELLRQEGGYFNQVRNTKKSSIRLKDALLENNLAMPLCILMAQQRNCIAFNTQENSHLKLVGKLYDQCQDTLVQYGSFLANNLSIEDYIGRLPSLQKLIGDFNLSPDVTFFLVRPMIIHNINSKFDVMKKGEKSQTKISHHYGEAYEVTIEPLVTSLGPAFPQKFWVDLSPRFFVTFWTLTMYDLEVPTSSYESQLDKFKVQIQQIEDNKDLAPNKRKKEKERHLKVYDNLSNECISQQEHIKRVHKRLQNEKDQWFQSKVAKMEMTTQFLQHCLFPRCKFTASDALYCAKFVHLLHMLQTPNFSTLICYDRIFGDISYTMCSCTENEANHYGRFLSALLETVMKWHKEKNIFEKECAKYPGFVTKFCEKDPVHVDFENYRHVCHKWHYRLTKAFILCLDSGDYIQIRNSLIILTKVLAHFPVMISFAQAIERRVDNIRTEEKEKRPDLYALATGYAGQLKSKKESFIPESEFHHKESKKTQASNASSKSSSSVNVKKENVKLENGSSTPTTNKLTTNVKDKKVVKSNSDVSESEKKKDSRQNDLNKSNQDLRLRKVKEEEKEKSVVKTSENKASNSTSSPRRNERSKNEEVNDHDKSDHKKRKVETSKLNNSVNEDSNDKRKDDSPHVRSSHDKKSARKRTQESSPNGESEPKRRKDDESKTKRVNNEERESSREPARESNRKPNEKSKSTSSSRRHKNGEDK